MPRFALLPILLSGLLAFTACFSTPGRTLSAGEQAAMNSRSFSGDFDGDRVADYAFWNQETARWFLITSKSPPPFRRTVRVGSGYQVWWGAPGDDPLVGDFDGDGITDLAVWRPTISTVYLLTSSREYPRPAVRHYDGFAIKVEIPALPEP